MSQSVSHSEKSFVCILFVSITDSSCLNEYIFIYVMCVVIVSFAYVNIHIMFSLHLTTVLLMLVAWRRGA